MKIIYLILLFLAVSKTSISAQVGIGTTSPKGALDVTSTDSGMLVPRVQLTAFLTASPVINPQGGVLEDGTLVYNIGPVTPDNMAAGFYFWQVNRWVALAGSAPINTAWLTTGNAGTSSATNYVGTTDAVDLHFRANGSNKFRIPSATNQVLGYGGTAASPTYSWNTGDSTGMFLQGTNNIRFSTDGTSRFQIPNANQVHAMLDGSATLPFYSWSNATTTGMFKVGNTVSAQLAFATNANERMRIKQTGEVGVGTTDPKTILEAAGALSLNEGTALSLSNGTNNNIALGTAPFSLYRVTGPTAAFSITGIVPVTGANGQIVTIENTTAYNMTIEHQITSTAANQILCPGAKNLALIGQYATVTLQYNATQSRWIVKSSVGDTVAGSHNTLDKAYDEGGTGAGRAILADAGAVLISNNSNDSGLEIINNSTTSGVSGQYNSVINNGTIGYVADVMADGVGVLIDHSDTNNPYSGLQVTNYSTNATAAGIYASTMATAPALAVEGGNAANTIATPNVMRVTNFRTNGGAAIDASGAIGIRSTSSVAGGSAYSGFLNAAAGAAGQFNGSSTAAINIISNFAFLNPVGSLRLGIAAKGNRLGVFSNFTGITGAAYEAYMETYNLDIYYGAAIAFNDLYDIYFKSGQQPREEKKLIANVIGAGINATTIKKDDKTYIMPAVSAPENIFQDYGTGKLENGRAKIEINPILTENILVDDKHPIKVFIQLEGDCKGVYVTNKSAKGFEVIELGEGTSNVDFSYSLVATRASQDIQTKDGSITTVNYSGRFMNIKESKSEMELLGDKEVKVQPVKRMRHSKEKSGKLE